MNNTLNACNCRKKGQCPLQNNCLATSIVYNAHVTTDENSHGKNYLGLTEGTFKQRDNQRNSSLNNTKKINSTELSKYLWKLKSECKNYHINWSIITPARAYSNGSKRCKLCLSETLCILQARKENLLNKRDELISKCRHENKFYMKNYKKEVT